MSYDCVFYDDLVEGQDILAFGHHVVRWNFETMGTPAYGFVPSKDEAVIGQLQAEIERLKAHQRWIPVKETDLQTWKKYFITCKSSNGKLYTGMAQYFAYRTVLEEDFINEDFYEEESITDYDEENDCYWVKEGWFEFTLVGEIAHRLHDEVILVIPLPKPPLESEGE